MANLEKYALEISPKDIDRLARSIWGIHWRSPLCQYFGMSLATINRYMTLRTKPPRVFMLALHAAYIEHKRTNGHPIVICDYMTDIRKAEPLYFDYGDMATGEVKF